LIPASRWTETQPLPEDPAQAEVPSELPKGDWVEPIKKDEPAPDAGILISEERAWRDAQFRIRYPELRKNYIADRGVMGAHRSLYEERYATAMSEIEKLQPTWWDRNKLALGFTGGVILGAGVTVGVVVAVLAATQEVRVR